MDPCELQLDCAITRNYEHSDSPLPVAGAKALGCGREGGHNAPFHIHLSEENLAKEGSGWKQPQYSCWAHVSSTMSVVSVTSYCLDQWTKGSCFKSNRNLFSSSGKKEKQEKGKKPLQNKPRV